MCICLPHVTRTWLQNYSHEVELSFCSLDKLLMMYLQMITLYYIYFFGTRFNIKRHAKGVIRIRKSKKNRQHNGQKKKDKMSTLHLKNESVKVFQLVVCSREFPRLYVCLGILLTTGKHYHDCQL